MNGLKLIRTQCNISLSGLAEILGVTRQIISIWEHGKKEIPEARLEQLSEYFGIEAEFFGEITEEQKQYVLNKPMFTCGEGEDGYYLYRNDNNRKGYSLKFKERNCLLSEEFQTKKQNQKDLVSQINKQINGPVQLHLMNQVIAINRGVQYYGYCLNNLDLAYSKASTKKMSYYHRLIEILMATTLAFGGDCELPDEKDSYCYAENPLFIKDLAEYIKSYMNPLMDEIDEIVASRHR